MYNTYLTVVTDETSAYEIFMCEYKHSHILEGNSSSVVSNWFYTR